MNFVRKSGGEPGWGNEYPSVGIELTKVRNVSGNVDRRAGELLNSRGVVDAGDGQLNRFSQFLLDLRKHVVQKPDHGIGIGAGIGIYGADKEQSRTKFKWSRLRICAHGASDDVDLPDSVFCK